MGLCACPRPAPLLKASLAPVASTAAAPFDVLRLVPVEAIALARLDAHLLFSHPLVQARSELQGAVEGFREIAGLDPTLLSNAWIFYLPGRGYGRAWRAAVIVPGDLEASPGLAEPTHPQDHHGHAVSTLGQRGRLAKVPGAIVLGDDVTVRAALDAFDGRGTAMTSGNRLAGMLRAQAAGVFRFATYWPALQRYVDRSLDPGLARAVVLTVSLEPQHVHLFARIDTPDAARFVVWAKSLLARLHRERDIVWRLLGPLLRDLVIAVEDGSSLALRANAAATVSWRVPLDPVLRVLPIVLRSLGL